MLQFCPKAVTFEFKRAATDEDKNIIQMPDELFNQFRDTYALKFAGFVFYALLNTGIQGNQQAFYTNFALRYHGLSRFGIALQSKFGYGLPLTTMDRLAEKQRSVVAQELRYAFLFVLLKTMTLFKNVIF